MKTLLGTVIVIIAFFTSSFHASAACCSWSDKTACASCPSGYSSGCVTEGNSCTCDCAKNENEMSKKLSKGNRSLEYFIRNNYGRILHDTNQRGYFRSYDFPDIKISISPPKSERPRW